MRLTRMGRFDMGGDAGRGPWSPVSLMRRLLGGKREGTTGGSAGERQMRALRRVPKLLRFIPGPAQDVRAYYLVLQYWLAGSADNLANLVRLLVVRYASVGAAPDVPPPVDYPDVGAYRASVGASGRVGVLVMRSYVLAGNTAHYDAVIAALEARGLGVVAAYASGLDNRPAIERFFMDGDAPAIDALVSLTGFSLVGGPAYSDAESACALLARLDVPYVCAQALEFQSVEEWHADPRGINALQATLQIAIPELEGATNPIVFAGKSSTDGRAHPATRPIAERVARRAQPVARHIGQRPPAGPESKVARVQ
jgi:magnesium chelatase subunit H